MESRAGSILTLIGGILTLILAFIVLVAGVFVFSFTGLQDKVGGEVSLYAIGIILAFIFIVLLVGGILKIYASRLMMHKKTVVKGGVIAIILGVVVSDLFSLIGGVIAVVQGEKK